MDKMPEGRVNLSNRGEQEKENGSERAVASDQYSQHGCRTWLTLGLFLRACRGNTHFYLPLSFSFLPFCFHLSIYSLLYRVSSSLT